MRKSLLQVLLVLTVLSLVLSACGAGTPAVEEVGGFQIPTVEEGKFNVGMVLIGPHDDGGWSQAHYEGLLYVEENVPNTHVAYIENVPEGADSEQVFRALARKGFDLIFGTSFQGSYDYILIGVDYVHIVEQITILNQVGFSFARNDLADFS